MSLRTFFLPTAKPDAGGAARFGRVLYWGFIVAAAILLFLVLAIANNPSRELFPFGALIIIVMWLIGRACRYVLAGE